METSLILAQIIGPILFVMGFRMAINAEGMRAIGEQFIESPILIYLSGFVALTLGLIIVTFHNVWMADWPAVITILGWLSVAAGVVRMLMPGAVTAMGGAMLASGAKPLLMTSGALMMALGAWLAVMGYGLAG